MKFYLLFSVVLTLLTANYAFTIECKAILLEPNWTDSHRNSTSGRLIDSYFRLAPLARIRGGLPEYLRTQSLVYILDEFSISEQARLATLFDETALLLEKANAPTVVGALKIAADSEIVAKLITFDRDLNLLRRQHKLAVKLALDNHDKRGQRYGDEPYSFHLRKVRGVLKRYGYGPKDSLLGLRLGTAAWLHDVVEDTPVTHEIIEALLGKLTADIVTSLTNEPDRPGVSKADQKRITFERIALLPESRILKLADRIANVEESLSNMFLGKPNKIEKYSQEWPAFKKYIYRPNEAVAMWEHLEKLLTDMKYARQILR